MEICDTHAVTWNRFVEDYRDISLKSCIESLLRSDNNDGDAE